MEDDQVRADLNGLFTQISDEKGFKIIECGILDDHVHLLIDQSYALSTSWVMKQLKGISARLILQKYDDSRSGLKKLWGRSFNARKVPSRQLDSVISYIRGQRGADGVDKRY